MGAALQIAREMRAALLEIGCVCTEIESSWISGSAKFIVCSGPVGSMHSRTIAADGTLTVRKLV